MPFTRIGNLNLYYEIHGSGPQLLYISGTGGDLRVKPNLFDSPLPQHFTVLGYDQRGLGQTDKPDQPYTMADYAADAAALLDAVGWETALVMGVSFGGMVAQEFAVSYPERVEKLVLACTSSGGAGGASYPVHTFYDLPPAERPAANLPISDTRLDAAWQAHHPQQFAEMVAQAQVQLSQRASDPISIRGQQRQLEARLGHDVYDRLPRLTMPVYICGGRYDGIAPIDNLQAIQQQIPQSQLALFEGGHGFLQQDSTAYQEIITFLQDIK